MSRLTVSVVIPAYRAAHTIGRALDSALGQTRPPDEILVVDDGSPDDTGAAVRPYGDRVNLIRQPNGGAARARNLGIDRTGGDLIAFLDADDYWEPTKLERQLALFAAYPELGLVGGRWYTQTPGAARPALPPCADPDFDRVLAVSGARAFSVAMKLSTIVVTVRREALDGHRFPAGLATAEDRDLWVRLVAAVPVYMTSDPLATYVQEPGSLTRSDVDRDYSNMLRVVHRHAALLGPRGVRRWEAQVFRGWAACYLGLGEPRAAVRPAWHRLVRNALSAEGWWVFLKSGVAACRRPA